MLLALMTLAVVIRVPFFAVPMISDEGGYAYVARFWSSTYQLYRDIPFDRPQGIFLIYKVVLAAFGTDVVAIRLAAALYNAATTAALFLLTRDVLSARVAWWTALGFALFSASPGIHGFAANGELFTALPLVVAAHLTWWGKWGWAGLVSGLATVIKPSGISGLLLTLAWLGVAKAPRSAAARAVGGFVVAPLVSFAHGYLVGWEHFWDSFGRMMFTVSVVATDWRVQLRQLGRSSVETAAAWIVLAVLAVLAVMRGQREPSRFGVLWVAAAMAGMAIGGSWFPHYFIQLVPPWPS